MLMPRGSVAAMEEQQAQHKDDEEQGYEGAGVKEGGGYQRSSEGGGGYEESGTEGEGYDPRREAESEG